MLPYKLEREACEGSWLRIRVDSRSSHRWATTVDDLFYDELATKCLDRFGDISPRATAESKDQVSQPRNQRCSP